MTGVQTCALPIFKREEERVGGYNGRTVVKPSMFERMVLEQVQPMIKEAISGWLSEHHEEVEQAINGVVEQGIAATVVKVFRDEMRQPMYEMGGRLQQVINKLGGI